MLNEKDNPKKEIEKPKKAFQGFPEGRIK